MNPVLPFEPVLTEQIPKGEQWIAQVKWDGVRILTYYDGQTVRLFNRNLNERTAQYPELHNIQRFCSASSVILDGEMVAFSEGKPSFYEIMRRDGIRKIDNLERAKRETPVTYMVFDILFYNGEWLIRRPLANRQALLYNVLIPQPDIHLVENFPDGEHLFHAVKALGLEGIVCKDLTSSYTIGGKDARWRKRKNYRDLNAVVGGFTLRDEIVNSLLLGLYDQEDRLWYIGHAGTGKLTQQDWRDLSKTLKPLVIQERPFVNRPERNRNAFWVKPLLTAKIQYFEWTPQQTLRQPSIQAFLEVLPETCRFTGSG